MPRRPASVTQAEIQRAIRAAKKAGADSVRVLPTPEIYILKDGERRRLDLAEIPKKKQKPGYIYVVGFDRYVKIGYTTDVDKRLAQLQVGMPKKLVVYWVMPDGRREDEAELHARFHEYRLQGEWFRREGRLATWIKTCLR